MKTLLIHLRNLLVGCTLAICSGTLLNADEPLVLGYERWFTDPVESRTEFFLKPAEIYGVYADKWTLVGAASPSCGYRLIDIEPADVRGTRFNIVWIKNEDNYATKSYFLYALSKDEVVALTRISGFYILDIESYGDWWEPRKYAVILRANPLNFRTQVLTGVTYSELTTWLAKTDWRPLDIDMHQTEGEYTKMPKRYDESMNLYDAVFTFAPPLFNRVDTWVAYGDHLDILAIQEDYHVIDVENTGDWYQHYYPDRPFMYIFVDKGTDSRHLDFQAFSKEYAFENGLIDIFSETEQEFSRCVDVEYGSGAGAMGVFKE